MMATSCQQSIKDRLQFLAKEDAYFLAPSKPGSNKYQYQYQYRFYSTNRLLE